MSEPLCLDLTQEEVDLLADSVADTIARMVVRDGDLLDQPRMKAKFEGYIRIGNKLGMNL